jgi:hypothetical protein
VKIANILVISSLLRSSSFLSYTETEEEVSFIIDEKSLQLFNDSLDGRQFQIRRISLQFFLSGEKCLNVAPKCWKALQIYEGASAISKYFFYA